MGIKKSNRNSKKNTKRQQINMFFSIGKRFYNVEKYLRVSRFNMSENK